MSRQPLDSFPRTLDEALTMIYLEGQDLSKLNPEEFVNLYKDTSQRIKVHLKNS